MTETTVTSTVAPAAAGTNFSDRKHRLAPPKTLSGRFGLWLQDKLETFVAGVSINGDPQIYDSKTFPWAAEGGGGVEKDPCRTGQRDEVSRPRSRSFQDILKEVESIQTDNDWKTFFLLGIGMDCAENAKRCPETMRLLGKIPGVKTAFFSILSPHKHIPAHRGAYNGVLRFHLGLMVPEPREKVRIRVHRQMISATWTEGKSLIFDDTFNHEVWNDTEGYRVVLFVDFTRPLKQPWHWVNERFLNIGALAPFLREAGKKQSAWQKKFYKKP